MNTAATLDGARTAPLVVPVLVPLPEGGGGGGAIVIEIPFDSIEGFPAASYAEML